MQHRFVCQGTFGDRSGGINKNNKINQDFFSFIHVSCSTTVHNGIRKVPLQKKKKAYIPLCSI